MQMIYSFNCPIISPSLSFISLSSVEDFLNIVQVY